jgi:hypothetical protein
MTGQEALWPIQINCCRYCCYHYLPHLLVEALGELLEQAAVELAARLLHLLCGAAQQQLGQGQQLRKELQHGLLRQEG